MEEPLQCQGSPQQWNFGGVLGLPGSEPTWICSGAVLELLLLFHFLFLFILYLLFLPFLYFHCLFLSALTCSNFPVLRGTTPAPLEGSGRL